MTYTCRKCGGSGEVEPYYCDILKVETTICPVCDGKGYIVSNHPDRDYLD